MKLFFLFAVLMPCMAVKDRDTVILDGIMYFSDSTIAMTREKAKEYCIDQGGELARIYNKTVYDVIRLRSKVASYWIDGSETTDTYRFQFSFDCSYPRDWYDGYMNLYGVSTDIKAVSCLSLVKGATMAKSFIESVNCEEERSVICQYPVDGCNSNGGTGTQWFGSSTTAMPEVVTP